MKMHHSSILEVKNISKSFGVTKALTDVSIKFEAGSIHAVLGENGAGKSTLMNVIGGVISPDDGEIIVDGESYTKLTPRKSMEIGISFVHQELSLIEDLSIYQNIFLGNEIHKKGILNKKAMINKSVEILAKLGMEIDVNKLVEDISGSQRQIVEIAKNLLNNPRVMILDEPTASLENHEVSLLFDVMRKLKAENVAIVYISHKMPEIFEICDTFTVLRDGINVSHGDLKMVSKDEVIKDIVGEEMTSNTFKKESNINSEVVLQVNKLGLDECYDDITFNVHKGEVLAFTGLQGDGRLELIESIYGIRKNARGSVKVNNNLITKTSISNGRKNNIAFVASNRKVNSIVSDLSILSNFKLNNFETFIYKKKIFDNEFLEYINMLSIKINDSSDPITSLSGGNQQKVVLSRALRTRPDILILDNPTQGIDIKAKEEVYNFINDLAKEGLTIIVNSSEIPEISKIADRCLVMYNNKIVKELMHSEINESVVMQFATGMKEGEYFAK